MNCTTGGIILEHFFKSTRRSFLGIIGWVLLIFLFALILFFIAWIMLDILTKLGTSISAIVAAVPSIALFAFMVVRILKTSPVDYLVTETELRFLKGNEVVQVFPYKDYIIGSIVTNMYYSGIASGKIRQITVNDGKKQTVHQIMLSKKNFNSFMAYISSYSAIVAEAGVE